MPSHHNKHRQKRRSTHPRQQKMIAADWRDYLPEDIGTIVLSALDAGRGVFLGVTPSEELLTLRVYHEHGYTPCYGRSFGELFGRVQKLRATSRKIERSELRTTGPIALAAPQPPVDPLIALWGFSPELAERLHREHEQRALWMSSQPPLKERLRTCRRTPPPLK